MARFRSSRNFVQHSKHPSESAARIKRDKIGISIVLSFISRSLLRILIFDDEIRKDFSPIIVLDLEMCLGAALVSLEKIVIDRWLTPLEGLRKSLDERKTAEMIVTQRMSLDVSMESV